MPDLPDPVRLPIVTVLGGGIAGLTAAHELVERGFQVQVAESRPSSLEENCCEIGGLAANLFTRIRAPVGDLHKKLSDEDLKRANRFRDCAPMEASSRRFPMLPTIRFDKFVHYLATLPDKQMRPPDYDQAPRTTREPPPSVVIPTAWQDYWDEYGAYSNRKLGDVLETIRQAAQEYMQQYIPALAKRLALGTAPNDEEWAAGHYTTVSPQDPAAGRRFVAREILVVQIVGYTDTDGTAEQNDRKFMGHRGPRQPDRFERQAAAGPANLAVGGHAGHRAAGFGQSSLRSSYARGPESLQSRRVQDR